MQVTILGCGGTIKRVGRRQPVRTGLEILRSGRKLRAGHERRRVGGGAPAPTPFKTSESLTALRATGVKVRDDATARTRSAVLRGLYEPVVVGLAEHFRFVVPAVWPADEKPDDWQTSAWMRRADPLHALGADHQDDHFD